MLPQLFILLFFQLVTCFNVEHSPRIFNADGNATRGQIPYQALVFADGVYIFGGVLISTKWVLTSAEAVFGYSNWTVTLGGTDLNAEEPERVTLTSLDGHAHPLYADNSSADIGLINLPSEVVVGDYIQVALLPSDTDTYDGYIATVSGFGVTTDGGELSSVLRYANLIIITDADCGNYYALDGNQICAVGPGAPCPGDNGGPLVVTSPEELKNTLVGISSFGPSSGCETPYPAGFTRVSAFLPWINSLIQEDVTGSLATRTSGLNSYTPRIFNADGNATLGDIPYQALVIVDGGFVFGGTLISEEWILTSAECVFGHTTWDITLGIVNVVDDEPGRITLESKTAIAHPDFSPASSNNDIGLIKLPTPVNESVNIWRAYLPSPSEEDATFAGEMVIASGFGNTGSDGSVSQTLRYTNLVVLANSACQSYYDILDIEMCAFGQGATCPGDNGGPLVLSYPKDGTYKVVGVSSFGPHSGCNVTYPDGFTRVSKYLTWIYNSTGIQG